MNKILLKGGLSGSRVEKHGNIVRKYDERKNFLLNQYLWMKTYDELTPKTFTFRDNYYEMEYIHNKSDKNYNDYILDIIKKVFFIKDSNRISFKENKFNTYFEYIQDKIKFTTGINSEVYLNELIKYEKYFNNEISCCHGDLTLDNIIINNDNKIYLIDSNFKYDIWQSWLLDVSKLYQKPRLEFNESNSKIISQLDRYFIKERGVILLLEISHYIRMIPYINKQNNELLDEVHRAIKLCWNEYKNL